MSQRILLECNNPYISKLLTTNPEYQIEAVHSYFSSPNLDTAHRTFALLDIEAYRALGAQEQKILANGDLIILLAEHNCTEVLDTKVGSNVRYFYLDCTSEISIRNLLTVLGCISDLRKINQRLNFYIRDSFSDIVDSNILKRQKLEIEDLYRKLNEISRVDYLTNLLNRRALLESFESERRRALRCRWRMEKSRHPETDDPGDEFSGAEKPPIFTHQSRGELKEHLGNFSCIMLDIDHFKQVNDSYGHVIGDTVLKTFGALLLEPGLFRDTDVIGRYGGEEFIVLLPETNSKHAIIPAERLRSRIKNIAFDDGKGGTFSITISIGIAEFQPEELSPDELIKRADTALYQAKGSGRDRICIYGEIVPAG